MLWHIEARRCVAAREIDARGAESSLRLLELALAERETLIKIMHDALEVRTAVGFVLADSSDPAIRAMQSVVESNK